MTSETPHSIFLLFCLILFKPILSRPPCSWQSAPIPWLQSLLSLGHQDIQLLSQEPIHSWSVIKSCQSCHQSVRCLALTCVNAAVSLPSILQVGNPFKKRTWTCFSAYYTIHTHTERHWHGIAVSSCLYQRHFSLTFRTQFSAGHITIPNKRLHYPVSL